MRAAEPQHIANALWAVASVDAVPEVRDLIQRAQMHSLSRKKSFNRTAAQLVVLKPRLTFRHVSSLLAIGSLA